MKIKRVIRSFASPKVFIPTILGLSVLIALGLVAALTYYIPTHTKSYATTFDQYVPGVLPAGVRLTDSVIEVAPRRSTPGTYLKVLFVNTSGSLVIQQEREGEITPKGYRASCTALPDNVACKDLKTPKGQPFVYTDYTATFGTPVIIASTYKGDTLITFSEYDGRISEKDFGAMIDSLQLTQFTKATIKAL